MSDKLVAATEDMPGAHEDAGKAGKALRRPRTGGDWSCNVTGDSWLIANLNPCLVCGLAWQKVYCLVCL